MTMPTLNPYLAPILAKLAEYFDNEPLTNEYQIIKHLQEQKISPFDDFSLAQTKDLFHAHFLCMHALYHLKKQYQQEQKYSLIIESVRVQRTVLATQQVIPDQQVNAVAVPDPLESYYLDPQHYFATQEDEINGLLKTFWQKYLAQDERSAAFAALNLPNNADAKMIKIQYLRLAQQYHPDKGGCAEMFAKISHAKNILDKCF